ncbi:hypothetical protein ACUXAU_002127 [Staphylococcus caprae]
MQYRVALTRFFVFIEGFYLLIKSFKSLIQ